MNPFIVQTGGVLRQKGPADLDDLRIHLYKIDTFYTIIAGQLLYHTAVSGTDDQDVFNTGVYCHGNVRDHLIVDKFIPLGEHDVAVQSQYTAELRRIEDIDLLVAAPLRIQMSGDADAVFYVRRMKFAKPQIHGGILL